MTGPAFGPPGLSGAISSKLHAVLSYVVVGSLPQHVHGSPQRPARWDPHDTIHAVKTIKTQFFRPNILIGFEELLGGFWDPWVVLGVPRGTLGVPGEAMEGPLGILGCPLGTLGGPLGAMGEPRGSLGGAPGAILRFIEITVFPKENTTF